MTRHDMIVFVLQRKILEDNERLSLERKRLIKNKPLIDSLECKFRTYNDILNLLIDDEYLGDQYKYYDILEFNKKFK